MVVRRRGTLMGLVAVSALALSVGFLWRFAADRGLVPFLLGCALLAVGLVHVVAWRESRTALLVADLTGLQVRLGAGSVVLPWSEVESVEVAGRGRLGDGRLVVRARDELRVLADAGVRRRFAVLLNRWVYDAALVVPYGLSTRVTTADIPGELSRLADGRAEVVVLDEVEAEPAPTVEVASPGTLAAPEPTDITDQIEPTEPPAQPVAEPLTQPLAEPAAGPAHPLPARPRRLASVVSALRAQEPRRQHSAPVRHEPATAGTLALAPDQEVRQPLPEVEELRRRPPEEEPGLRAGMAAARLTPLEHGNRAAEVAIGDRIREAREWLGVSVDDLAERTRIRPSVIESIEVGDFTACGGDFYARGHLRMLAGTLGIDEEPILASYEQHVASEPVSPRAVFDAELSRGVVRPAGTGSRWGALIATVVVLIVVWVAVKVFFGDSTDPSGSAPPLTTRHHGAAVVTHRPSINDPAIGSALPESAPPVHVTVAATTGASRVVIRDATMKVIYEGTLQPGQSAGISGTPPLRVMASNAGVVTLAAPGHPPTTMGQPGQRAYRRILAPA